MEHELPVAVQEAVRQLRPLVQDVVEVEERQGESRKRLDADEDVEIFVRPQVEAVVPIVPFLDEAVVLSLEDPVVLSLGDVVVLSLEEVVVLSLDEAVVPPLHDAVVPPLDDAAVPLLAYADVPSLADADVPPLGGAVVPSLHEALALALADFVVPPVDEIDGLQPDEPALPPPDADGAPYLDGHVVSSHDEPCDARW